MFMHDRALFCSDDVIQEIEEAGATYSKTVTKKVTHLVVADPNSTSAKA
jgi:hypothetical protein